MKKHECVIGLYHLYDESILVTETELHKQMTETNSLCELIDKQGLGYIKPHRWTLRDYCDRRISTNLVQFDYCPYCAKKIDWRVLKQGGIQ